MSQPRSSPIQIDDLFNHSTPHNPLISLNGSQVLYTAAPAARKGEHTISALWLADIGVDHSARQLTSGSFNDTSPAWSPDGSTIAFVSDRAKAGSSSAVYLLPINGGEAYPVTEPGNEKAIKLFGWSLNGKFLAYTSSDEKSAERKVREESRDDAVVYGEEVEHSYLRILNVKTRMVGTLGRKLEGRHVMEASWSGDSMSLVLVLSESPEQDSADADGLDVVVVDVGKMEMEKLFHFPGRINGPLVWTREGLFFLANKRPSFVGSSSVVYKCSMEGKDRGTYWRIAHGKVDCAVGLERYEDFVGVKIEAGLSDEIEILGGPTLISEEATIHDFDIHSLGKEGFVIAFTKEAVNSPTEVYSKTSSGKVVQLSTHGISLSSQHFGTYTPLHCPSFDHTSTLDGYYISPSTATSTSSPTSSPLPTYVAIHGGPYMRSTNSFDASYFNWTPLLLSANYGILIPNYRGNSSRGDAFAAPAIGGVGTVDYDDIIAMVQEGIDQGFVNPKRIVVGGWSQGGFLSYLSAVRNGAMTLPNGKSKGWKFVGAICGAGVTDWDMMSMTSNKPTFESECAGIAPWAADKQDIRGRRGSAIWEMSAANSVSSSEHMSSKKIEKDIPPILILHGEKDERVPVTQAVAFRRGCVKYGIPCEMVVYPREPHMIGERAHLVDMAKRVLRFVDGVLQ